MDLRRLNVFVTVADLGSFSRAAQALDLSQPTVSEHVRTLEQELGVVLLDRGGRATEPTPVGRLLLGHARRILELAREARQAVEGFQGHIAGLLVVGGSTIPGEYVLPGALARFAALHPEVRARLMIAPSRQVCAWVEAGTVEAGVVGAPPDGRPLEARRLMDDELVLVVPADHPWASRERVSLEDLAREPLVVREDGSGSRQALERGLREAGTALGRLRVAGEFGSTQALKQAVRAGLGVAFVSRRAVADECGAALLRCVGLEGPRLVRAFHLVTRPGRTPSPAAQAFVGLLESDTAGGASH